MILNHEMTLAIEGRSNVAKISLSYINKIKKSDYKRSIHKRDIKNM